MTTEKQNPIVDDKTPEVDRIRDIIFGSQMRAYEGNFQTIHRDLDRLQQGIDRLKETLAEQEKNTTQRIQALERDMCQADDALRAELRETARRLVDEKVDRHVLGDLFIELGSQLKSDGSLAGTFEDMLGPKED